MAGLRNLMVIAKCLPEYLGKAAALFVHNYQRQRQAVPVGGTLRNDG